MDLASVKLKILVIGGGRMGNAFIEGLSHSAENQIHVVEPNSSVKAKLKIDFDVTVSNYDDPEKHEAHKKRQREKYKQRVARLTQPPTRQSVPSSHQAQSGE